MRSLGGRYSVSNEAAGYAALIARLQPLQMIDVRLLTTDGRQLVRTRYTEPEPELNPYC